MPSPRGAAGPRLTFTTDALKDADVSATNSLNVLTDLGIQFSSFQPTKMILELPKGFDHRQLRCKSREIALWPTAHDLCRRQMTKFRPIYSSLCRLRDVETNYRGRTRMLPCRAENESEFLMTLSKNTQ